ncbi:MAG: hypothetical protein ABH834_07270 [Candidatus Altiarchaeota archaeon]
MSPVEKGKKGDRGDKPLGPDAERVREAYAPPSDYQPGDILDVRVGGDLTPAKPVKPDGKPEVDEVPTLISGAGPVEPVSGASGSSLSSWLMYSQWIKKIFRRRKQDE